MKYRSKLEQRFHRTCPAVPYEPTLIPYVVTHTYTPDFQLGPDSYIEVKGLFSGADRRKHLYIKEQQPHVRIKFMFSDPHMRLSRKSKTTYAAWCDKHGFEWGRVA